MLAKDITVEFSPAGHILSASIVSINDGNTTITFSGDLGRSDDPIMVAPAIIKRTDYLVLESTYGNRKHDPSDTMELMGNTIRETVNRGGVVVIPSFAVGRAQLLLHYVHLLKRSGAILPQLPVYLNSPMAKDATALYNKYHEEHRLTAAQTEAMCQTAKIINTVEESKALNLQRMPMVIFAASGMATGGRVLHP